VVLERPPAPAGAVSVSDAAPPGGQARGVAGGVFYDRLDLSIVANARQVARGRDVLGTASAVLGLYSTLLDDVPYPSLTLALLDNDLPGGHSPAYFGLLYEPLPTSPFTWRDDPVHFDGFPQFFLAHELAHQFWGQAVGWKSYHEQWISEGFAQYFAALYAERARGPAVFGQLIRQMRRSALEHARRGPIYLGYRLTSQGNSQWFRAVVYNKGAMVLHMLRRLMGDDPFFATLRSFYRDARFTKTGTEDFRRVAEREAGRDLERFFRKWILEAGIPTLSVGYTLSEKAALVVVEQAGEPFDLPLTLTVVYVSGEREDTVVPVTGSRVEHALPLRDRVRTLEANADGGTLAVVTTTRLQ